MYHFQTTDVKFCALHGCATRQWTYSPMDKICSQQQAALKIYQSHHGLLFKMERLIIICWQGTMMNLFVRIFFYISNLFLPFQGWLNKVKWAVGLLSSLFHRQTGGHAQSFRKSFEMIYFNERLLEGIILYNRQKFPKQKIVSFPLSNPITHPCNDVVFPLCTTVRAVWPFYPLL